MSEGDPENSAAAESTAEQPAKTTSPTKITDKDRLIASLKNELELKNQEMSDLQRGLETQVHMVMELERLEQKEMREYELKLQANRELINELGERVGQQSRSKAELETSMTVLRKKVEDQAAQLSRVQELNSVHQALFNDVKKDSTNANNNANLQDKPWELYQKLEDLMKSHQTLVQELDMKNQEVQDKRQEVCDRDLLCIELSSQLDKLASQLNHSDEEMAKVRTQAKEAEAKAQKSQARVEFLEKTLLEDNDSDSGKAALFQKLQDTEARFQKVAKERDVSLIKATSLSIALATTREHNDALQEKMQHQNNIVDRIMGKSHRVPVPVPKSPAQQQQSHQEEQLTVDKFIYRGPGDHIQSNASPPPSAKSTPPSSETAASKLRSLPARTLSGDGLLGFGAGPRIRSFFTNRRSPTAGTANGGGIPPSPSSGNNQNNGSNHSNNGSNNKNTTDAPPVLDPNIPDPNTTTDGKHNPFDDDEHNDFANPAVGMESQTKENSQGGGGDVNLALTL